MNHLECLRLHCAGERWAAEANLPAGVANDRIYARDRSRVAEWGGQVAGGVVDDGGQVGAAHAASDLPSESQPPG